MLATYLDRIHNGAIARDGAIEVLADGGAALAWHAHRLPGAWAMRQLSEAMLQRVGQHAVVTGTIADCSHIGCLQAYLSRFTAADVVSNAAVQTYAARGERTPGLWLVDGQGRYSDDASLIEGDPPATIAPLGGPEFGYKGYGFSLMVEALSLALTGYGRTSEPDRFGQSVFLQVIDPSGFAGRERFMRETSSLARRCRDSTPKSGGPPVRLPSDALTRTSAI
jgi:L-lactate dehydrogenase